MNTKSVFRILTAALLVIFCTIALSQETESIPPAGDELMTQAAGDCSASLCFQVLVNRLYVTTGGTTYISTSGTETDLVGCTPQAGPNGGYIILNDFQKNHKEVYTMLLAAQLTDRPVSIKAVANSVGKCKVSDARLDRTP